MEKIKGSERKEGKGGRMVLRRKGKKWKGRLNAGMGSEGRVKGGEREEKACKQSHSWV